METKLDLSELLPILENILFYSRGVFLVICLGTMVNVFFKLREKWQEYRLKKAKDFDKIGQMIEEMDKHETGNRVHVGEVTPGQS